jgi:hypothetical protein
VGKPPTKLYAKIAKPEDKNPGTSPTPNVRGASRRPGRTRNCCSRTGHRQHHAQLLLRRRAGQGDFEQVYVDILTQRFAPSPEKFF